MFCCAKANVKLHSNKINNMNFLFTIIVIVLNPTQSLLFFASLLLIESLLFCFSSSSTGSLSESRTMHARLLSLSKYCPYLLQYLALKIFERLIAFLMFSCGNVYILRYIRFKRLKNKAKI
jgi:hypothetical protein